MSFLSALVPGIATALGGPLAGAAVEFVASKLGVSDATQANIANTIQGLDPLKAKELDNQFTLAMAAQGIQLQSQQIAVDTEEAKSSSFFVSGGRPFVIWIGGFAFAYATIIEPIMRFVASVAGYKGGFPQLDTTITMQVLFALLGIGAMRSYDKKQGTSV